MQGRAKAETRLDVITIGRSSVDLYGQQIGVGLEDVSSFAKSVGGCPANIAIGAARLGLRSALLTRVGQEQMGRFIREQLAREGVDVTGVKTDPERLTALVLLSVRDEKTFPLIFYRENCADMALEPGDVDEKFIASSHSILVSGTHFSRPLAAAAQMRAIEIARTHGRKVIFDIDYRPNLWGLAGHAAGEERYIRSDGVTAMLAPVLAASDLIVGTEEEIHLAAGRENTIDAIKEIRRIAPDPTIVCKRGPMGCVVFPGPIPDSLDEGVGGPGFPVEVFNVLGAGDAFMAGFLRGWLRGEPLETCCTWANACGAVAVSRLLCSPEIPTWTELQHFLEHGAATHALRLDRNLNHIHWATTRRRQPERLMALAIDHRSQLEQIADEAGAPHARIARFKTLAVEAAASVAKGRPGYGILLDGVYGREALFRATDHGFWIGRPIESPGSRPLDFDRMDSLGAHLVEWPLHHTIKCLCFFRPDDPEHLKARQERELKRVYDAARTIGRELLIEIIAGVHGPLDVGTIPDTLDHIYSIGVRPDWWKLEPQADSTAWRSVGDVVRRRDPQCRGIVLLGLDAPEAELETAFTAARAEPLVKGFAVGRTIFAGAARAWLAGKISDEEAIIDMATRFARLTEAWSACAVAA
jgi:5-dehydro-2-deoxygluconokinase